MVFRLEGVVCLNVNKFCFRTVAGCACVCMCVFNFGMNLILISSILGMVNSCFNDLSSGFKIASICSLFELAFARLFRGFGFTVSGVSVVVLEVGSNVGLVGLELVLLLGFLFVFRDFCDFVCSIGGCGFITSVVFCVGIRSVYSCGRFDRFYEVTDCKYIFFIFRMFFGCVV